MSSNNTRRGSLKSLRSSKKKKLGNSPKRKKMSQKLGHAQLPSSSFILNNSTHSISINNNNNNSIHTNAIQQLLTTSSTPPKSTFQYKPSNNWKQKHYHINNDVIAYNINDELRSNQHNNINPPSILDNDHIFYDDIDDIDDIDDDLDNDINLNNINNNNIDEDQEREAHVLALLSKFDQSTGKTGNNILRKIQSVPSIPKVVLDININPNNKTRTSTHNVFDNNNICNLSPISTSTNNSEGFKRSRSISLSSTQSKSENLSTISATKAKAKVKAKEKQPCYNIQNHGNLMVFTGGIQSDNNNNNNNNNSMSRSKSVRGPLSTHNTRHLSIKQRYRDRKHRNRNRDQKYSRSEIGINRNNICIDNNDNNNSMTCSSPSLSNYGVLCTQKLASEWDCITISSNKEYVCLGGRNAMDLLRITSSGKLKLVKNLKAARKEGRLKYGAIDIQFNPSNYTKLVSVTRAGTLALLDFANKGRSSVSCTYSLKQRIHSITWMNINTNNYINNDYNECILAAANDGRCYLWDTRTDTRSQSDNNLMYYYNKLNNQSSSLSVRLSPFNNNIFGVTHENGNINIWDIRNNINPLLCIYAHESSSPCIDWHPSIPNIMASFGYRDITIKIWNLSNDFNLNNEYYNYCHNINNTTLNTHKSSLTPSCSMYPSNYLSQIKWRPSIDPKSLSANQIASSYIGTSTKQVVDCWDITSSYVPIASLSKHDSETKFEFILRDIPFRLDNDNDNIYNKNAKTYLITCSKDKSIKLTDCGYADIPRSHLSSCALDIGPFGNTCFVSVERQKLHPFDKETYNHNNQNNKNDNKYLSIPDLHKEKEKRRRHSGSNLNLQNNNINLKGIEPSKSDSEYPKTPKNNIKNKLKSKSKSISPSSVIDNYSNSSSSSPNKATKSTKSTPIRSNSFFSLLTRRKSDKSDKSEKSNKNIVITTVNNNNNNDEGYQMIDDDDDDNGLSINAMANGWKQSVVTELTDIFNHVDAFSQYETELSYFPLKNNNSNNNNNSNYVSPADDYKIFKYLAQNYKLKGKSIPYICKQNEIIMKNINNIELKNLWNLLGVLLTDILNKNRNNNNNNNNSNNNQSLVIDDEFQLNYNTSSSSSSPNLISINKNKKSNKHYSVYDNNIIELDDNDYSNNDWWMDDDDDNFNNRYQNNMNMNNNIYSPSSILSSLTNSIDHHSNTSPLMILENILNNNNNNDHDSDNFVAEYIVEVLYENIDRGDIQTAVTIIIMLEKYINLYLNIFEITDIILSYLDLLLINNLLIEAVKIYDLTKNNYKLIEKYFLLKSRIIIKCFRCKTIMQNNQCRKCRKYAKCNQCNQALIQYNNHNNNNNIYKLKHPNLLIWCQVCGHGGHYDHMIDWFKKKSNNNKIKCLNDNCKHQCQSVLIEQK